MWVMHSEIPWSQRSDKKIQSMCFFKHSSFIIVKSINIEKFFNIKVQFILQRGNDHALRLILESEFNKTSSSAFHLCFLPLYDVNTISNISLRGNYFRFKSITHLVILFYIDLRIWKPKTPSLFRCTLETVIRHCNPIRRHSTRVFYEVFKMLIN